MVSEHDQDEEHPQLSGGNGEEVDRDEIPDVIREERPPGLRGRCRALRDQAGDRTLGDLEAAYEALEHGLELEHLGQPFERARTLYVLGTVQRRDKKERAARASLESAFHTFQQLGSQLWATRAQAELSRIGGRPASSGLTPTEERVAALIASGRTYKETADALFISPKTVQWNLSKVYRKLGIRSRAELPTRLAAESRSDG